VVFGKWVGHLPLDRKNRLKNPTYRLPEAFCRIFHARCEHAEPAIPRGRAVYPAVVENRTATNVKITTAKTTSKKNKGL